VVLGGDLSRAATVTIDVVAIGSMSGTAPPGRGGARPGDVLWVTGALGGARAALRSWQHGTEPHPDARAAFAAPEPRLRAGRWLARHGAPARAMLDLSDGLAGDVHHLAARSRVAARVDLERLPLGPGVERAAAEDGQSPSAFAARGGEDYELLAALPPDFAEPEAEAFRAACGVNLSAVGLIEEGAGVRFVPDGLLEGYDHFA
jgi:thiamine-monophosphate kinase